MSQIVSLRVDGQLVELSTEASIRVAIGRKHLIRGTRVRIERDGRDDFVGEAGEDIVLGPLLDEIDPLPDPVAQEGAEGTGDEAAAPDDNPPVRITMASATPRPTPVSAPASPPLARVGEAPVLPSTPHGPEHEQPATGRERGTHDPVKIWLWIGFAVVAVIVLVNLMSGDGKGGGVADNPSDGGSVPVEAPTADAVPAPEIAAPVQTVYLRQAATILAQPSDGAGPVSRLDRGDQATGHWYDLDPAWFVVTDGSRLVGYLKAGELRNDPPPVLAEFAGRGVAQQDADLRDSPNPDASVVSRVYSGQTVETTGITASGWVEVLRADGPPTYLRREVFDAPAPVAETPVIKEPAAPPARPPLRTVIDRPQWMQMPSSEAMARVRPDKPLRGERHTVMMSCQVSGAGYLEACDIQRQSHPGSGMAEAALGAATRFRMAPTDRNGDPTQGRTVNIPFQFDMP